MVVLTQGIVFAVVYLFSPHHGLISTLVAGRRRRQQLTTAR
jgi:manganese transport system permease protein